MTRQSKTTVTLTCDNCGTTASMDRSEESRGQRWRTCGPDVAWHVRCLVTRRPLPQPEYPDREPLHFCSPACAKNWLQSGMDYEHGATQAPSRWKGECPDDLA